jgi:hypothetical protein
METGMILFTAKISPVLTYGLERIWDHLKEKDLTTLENVQGTLSRFAASRCAYTKARKLFLSAELRYKLLLRENAEHGKLKGYMVGVSFH